MMADYGMGLLHLCKGIRRRDLRITARIGDGEPLWAVRNVGKCLELPDVALLLLTGVLGKAWSRSGAWVGAERLSRDEQFYIARRLRL